MSGKPVIPCCYGGLKKGALPQPFASLHALEMPDDLYPLVVSVEAHLKPGMISPPPFLLEDKLVHAVAEAFRGKAFHLPVVLPPTG